MQLEDITVKRVAAAYAKHNHRPDRHYYWNGISPKGYEYWCPLQVLAVDEGGRDWANILSMEDTRAFMCGFDACNGSDKSLYLHPAYLLGAHLRHVFVDGAAGEAA